MSLADYIESAILGEGAGRSNELPQGFNKLETIVSRLKWLIGVEQSDAEVRQAIDQLISHEIIRVIRDEMAGDFYRIDAPNLIKTFNERSQDSTSIAGKYSLIGNQFLQNAIAKYATDPDQIEHPILDQPNAEVPASDRVVRLDDNSQVRDEILGRLDELALAVRGHNDEGGQLSDKERFIAELRSGQELLKAPTVRVRALWVVLGPLLAWFATEFAGGVIGELASILTDALKPLLGL